MLSSTPFLDLPLELRTEIYEYALAEPLSVCISTVEDPSAEDHEQCKKHYIPGLPAHHVPVLRTRHNASIVLPSLHADLPETLRNDAENQAKGPTSKDSDASDARADSIVNTEAQEENKCTCAPGTQSLRQDLEKRFLPTPVPVALLQTNKQIHDEVKSLLERHLNLNMKVKKSKSDQKWASAGNSFDSSQASFSDAPTPSSTPRERNTVLMAHGAGLSLEVSYPRGILVLKHMYPELLHHAHSITIMGHWNPSALRSISPDVESGSSDPARWSTTTYARRALRSLTRTILSPRPSSLLQTYNLFVWIPGADNYSKSWSDQSPISVALLNICGGDIDLKTKRGSLGTLIEMKVKPLPTQRQVTATFASLTPGGLELFTKSVNSIAMDALS